MIKVACGSLGIACLTP
nr:DUF3265 domain-containing protein [Vibrio parahaemolyticus]